MEKSDITELAEALKFAITESSPVQQVHISRYKPITPWNPTGSVRRVPMNGKYFQNGSEIQEWRVTDEDITLLNQLQPGRYMGRKVEVVERNADGDRSVDIRYSNKDVGQRMDMKGLARNFTELLQNIVTEQKPAKK